ncbi:MAG: response regulator [Proteobacteria bacterium]|nr:response regulator [Pseudomonadota bacterium]
MIAPDTDAFDESERTNPFLHTVRFRVLVVEDDPSLRELIVMRMRRGGFDVVEASDGDDALEILATWTRGRDEVDLVILDMWIPGTSGLDVVRILRGADWMIPVVLITAFPDREIQVEAAQLGIALLAKPFTLDHLSEAATAALVAQPSPGGSDSTQRSD